MWLFLLGVKNMAKRYRYAFVKKKEAEKGKLSVGLAVSSIGLFVLALLASFWIPEYGFVAGGISLFAMMLSIYGFIMGLAGFSEENRVHRTCIIGSISNGIIVVMWLGFYLLGV